jgi:hypothetical protein
MGPTPGIVREGEQAVDVPSASNAPAQNTAAQLPTQATAAGNPVINRWRAAAAPWVVQAMWLAAGLTTVVYLKIRDWGMFEIIPWLIGLIAAAAGCFAWLVAWGILAAGSVVWRLVYVVVGLVGLVAIVVWAIEPADTSSQFLLFVARINVGLVVPMVLVRRRGRRLFVIVHDATSARRVQHVWLISIGD